MEIRPVGYIRTDFPEKFGIPRQSGLVPDTAGRIFFYPEFRNPDAFNGLEGFSHIWLLWEFEVPQKDGWSATVKPPRLGGNTPRGVFATRSPFRPNHIGLSSVKLERIEFSEDGPVLHVLGADLKDGTRILDVKPYLAYTDSHPEASEGFSADSVRNRLEVTFDRTLLERLPEDKRQAAIKLLSEDPRPSYQDDPERQYGFAFAGFDIRFRVNGHKATVTDVVRYGKKSNAEA